MLRIIERVTKQPLEELVLPTVADVNEQRAVKFKARITEAVRDGQGRPFEALLKQIEQEEHIPAIDIAMALAGLLQGSTPFLLTPNTSDGPSKAPKSWSPPPRAIPEASQEESASDGATDKKKKGHPKRRTPDSDLPMESFRIEVGHEHGVQPGNIVGAIANEAGIEGRLIGHIDIRDDHSFVDLPEGVPDEILKSLEKTRIRGQALKIRRVEFKPDRAKRAHTGKPKRKTFGTGYKPPRFEGHKRKPPRTRK
jgi:ATP-dependent RNA helicase DeaD